MADERQTCPRCGKARKQEKHGSITQWITTCSCLAPEEAELQNVEVVPVCKNCGKRVSAGRSGSFTQWVFRSDLCSCEKPEVVQVTASSADSGKEQSSFHKERTEHPKDEPELALDPNTFPVDRYKPLALLDKGASGVVYLSRDRLLGTKAAVKCLLALSAEQLIAFQNEARANSKLNHPNIVKVLNFGATESGAPYMVMEFIKGVTLKVYIEERGALPMPLAVNVFTQICSALSYAHGKEIFHRDLKSSNIMIAEEGALVKAYLLDFGVAIIKQARQQPTIVQGYSVVGTPSYMPPDQSIGKPYDQRSEIYALGCVLFEALTGEVPFVGETAMEVIGMHASQPPPLLSEVNEDVDYPQELQAVVSRCLEKEQDDRFQSAEQLANELKEVGDESEFPGAQEFQNNSTGKNRKVRIIPTLIICTLIIGIVVVWCTAYFDQEILKRSATKEAPPVSVSAAVPDFVDAATARLQDASTVPPAGSTFWTDSGSKVRTKVYGSRLYIQLQKNLSDPDDELKKIDWHKLPQGKQVELDLSEETRFTGKGLSYLPFERIYSLRLQRTGIQDSAFKTIAKMSNLENLTLTYTRVSASGLRQITGLKNLRSLYLGYGPRIDDQAVQLITTAWPNLTNLYLADTQISRAAVRGLAKLKDLEALSLTDTPTNDEDVLALSRLRLSELYLNNCPVTDKTLPILEKMETLRVVGLYGSDNISQKACEKLRENRPDLKFPGEPPKEYVDFYFTDDTK